MARPHIRLKLPEQDRRILESWLRASKTDRVLAERAQIILACGQGLTATEVAERLSKRLLSVQMWRRRYLEQGVSGLEDRPRSGRPRKLSHANVRAILKATVERIPRESTYWSVRLMAEHSGVSKHQVAQIWKAADLKPQCEAIEQWSRANPPLQCAEQSIEVIHGSKHSQPRAFSMITTYLDSGKEESQRRGRKGQVLYAMQSPEEAPGIVRI